MALPVYIPSVPLIPPNAYFRDPDEKVYQPSSRKPYPLFLIFEPKED